MSRFSLPSRSLIGMVHVGALPGSPLGALTVGELCARAVAEARVVVEAGFDAVMLENMHDRPYVNEHGAATTAAMTRIVGAVRDALPEAVIGVQVLSSGEREALAVSLAVGCQFIRCENFVFAHVADEGLMAEAKAGPLLRYRKSIGAEHVAVWCDVKKKHASHAITADVSVAEAAEAAEFFGADGVIVTGTATGKPVSVGDVREARGATRLPIVVGSGVTAGTVGGLFEAGADALIVGSAIKVGGVWSGAVDRARCAAIAGARA